jgi:hypothetical protein
LNVIVAPTPVAVAVTPSPTKLIKVTLPAVPTVLPSSLIVIPSRTPAPAEVTGCQLHPPTPSAIGTYVSTPELLLLSKIAPRSLISPATSKSTDAFVVPIPTFPVTSSTVLLSV